jgi:hypothetical protein
MFCWWLCELCGIESGMWRYELIQMVGIEWHVFSEPRGSDILWQRSTPLFWDGSGGACGKISTGVRHRLKYADLRISSWNFIAEINRKLEKNCIMYKLINCTCHQILLRNKRLKLTGFVM